jgi:hypothetical protein
MMVQDGGQINISNTKSAKGPIKNGCGLFAYAFFGILLTLHAPYIFLGMAPDLIVSGDGLIYDMGGIFPHLGIAIISFFFQSITALGLYVFVSILKRLFKQINPFRILFLCILGLNAIIYHRIYFSGYIKPEILQRMLPFSLSWTFLAIFIALSLYSLIKSQ